MSGLRAPGAGTEPAAAPRLTRAQHALVLAVSLGLVCLFTFPLALDPGHLLPHHRDPLTYAWSMVSNVRRLRSAPLALFHGNTFYPNGNSLAYTDLVVAPTLFPAGPVYLLTGNPVLQYNVTLLVWWALSGWAMYVLALTLLRSHAAAAIAAIVFTLCPFRTDFFLEFQMQLAFPIPLAVLASLRFLETRRWRHLAALVLLLWVEALASMYYAIILGLALAVLAGLHALLRWPTWGGPLLARALVGAVLLGVLLAPFLLPYAQNRRELGMERPLRQPPSHSADVLTYAETGVAKLYRFRPTRHVAETSLFMGFGVLALATVASVRRIRPPLADATGLRRARAALAVGMFAGAAGFVLALAWSEALRAAGLHVPGAQRFLDAVLLLGLARFAAEGRAAARAGEGRTPLGERELRWICLFLVVLFFDLSLGPTIRVAGREAGAGLYARLYPVLLPLHAMRITSRLGVVVVLAVGLLAGMGTKALLARVPRRSVRAAVAAGCALLVLAEYHSFPLPYHRIEWEHPPPVYQALAADPDDVAVLEWPLGWEYWDADYEFWSMSHWKRLVNGSSGFLPSLTHEISAALSRPEIPGVPFPSGKALALLTGIHPLRYVVVHNDLLTLDEQRKWHLLAAAPWARLVGTYGSDDLYRLTGDAAGPRVDKLFSWDYARTRREITFQARSMGPAGTERWVEVRLNGRPLGRHDLGDGWTTVTVPLEGRLHRSAPNAVTLVHHYRRLLSAPAEPIGRTGAMAPPVDLRVVSAGFRAGNLAAVVVDGVEETANRRGYNVVALRPATGAVLWADAFNTNGAAEESGRMAKAIAGLPEGTIVIAAVKDDATSALTGDAVAALRSIGAREDIRGRYRVSHLVVGVKGAAPGTAVEQSGYRRLELTLGTPPDRTGLEVRDFALR